MLRAEDGPGNTKRKKMGTVAEENQERKNMTEETVCMMNNINALFLIKILIYIIQTCGFLFYSKDYNTLISFILRLQLSQMWAVGVISFGFCALLTVPHYSLNISFLSDAAMCSRFILYFFFPRLVEISLLSFCFSSLFLSNKSRQLMLFLCCRFTEF